ncbi:MAG: histidine kinase [Thalassolituus sp.]
MQSESLPLRIPYILRVGIIIALGISAWATAAVVVLIDVPASYFLPAAALLLVNGVAFCTLAVIATRDLLQNNLTWRVDNRDWRYWALLILAHSCAVALVPISQILPEHGPYMVLMVVNSASLVVRFSPRYSVPFNMLVALLFAFQFQDDQIYIFILCSIQQLVLWSFGLSIVVEVGEVRRLRVMGDELRMAQAQIAESERMLERRNIRHNLHDNMGHELATLHMNLQILEQQLQRHEVPGLFNSSLSESRAAARRMFVVLDDIVSGLRQVPAVHFYDAVVDLIDQATTLKVEVDWDEKVRIADPQHCEAMLSLLREFLTNVLKHSSGREVRIESHYRNGVNTMIFTDLAVCDDVIEAGNGLAGAAERVDAMNGELDVGLDDAGHLTWKIVMPESNP